MTQPIDSLIIGRAAQISSDGVYRYQLVRTIAQNPLFPVLDVDQQPSVVFVGLNPSTADDQVDDPTIRRCVRYAYDWGFSTLLMLNLFAQRTTDPKLLGRGGVNPIGLLNDETIDQVARRCDLVVGAWGADPSAWARASRVKASGALGPNYGVLGKTRDGHPRHPLYMSKTAVPLHHNTMRPLRLPRRLDDEAVA